MNPNDNLQKIIETLQIASKHFQRCRKILYDANSRIREQQIEINKLKIEKLSLTNKLEIAKQKLNNLEKQYKILPIKLSRKRKINKKLDLALLKVGNRVRKFQGYLNKAGAKTISGTQKAAKLVTLRTHRDILLQQISENKKQIDEIMALANGNKLIA